jgi:hypothetical protein
MNPGKGKADFWQSGDWNASCYRCGSKRKATEMRKQWQGYWVCPEHWEPRHPQDFVKAVPDNPSVPWAQPDNWIPVTGYCTSEGRSSITGFGTAGCAISGAPRSVAPSFCSITSRLPQTDIGSTDCLILAI